jgi:hypothetical protein
MSLSFEPRPLLNDVVIDVKSNGPESEGAAPIELDDEEEDSNEEADDLLNLIESYDEEEQKLKHLKFSIREDMRKHPRSRSCSPPSLAASSSSSHLQLGDLGLLAKPDHQVKVDEQVEFALDRILDVAEEISSPTLIATDLTEEDLFWSCHNRIESFLIRRAHDKYYIGVCESPYRRFFDSGIGHNKKYSHMHVLGASGSSRVVTSVEKRLIGDRKGIQSACENRGPGGEHISSRDMARFLYVCIR